VSPKREPQVWQEEDAVASRAILRTVLIAAVTASLAVAVSVATLIAGSGGLRPGGPALFQPLRGARTLEQTDMAVSRAGLDQREKQELELERGDLTEPSGGNHAIPIAQAMAVVASRGAR
jgi:hypothetical protein